MQRHPDPEDRRANRLFLTEGGRRLVDDLDSLRDAIAADILGDVAIEALQTSIDTLSMLKDRTKAASANPGRGSGSS